MKNRYSFTPQALANVAVYGITAAGRHLLVLVVESKFEDNDWDITAARDLDAEEIALFNRQTGRQP